MKTVVISADRAPSPGDIRSVSGPVRVVLRDSARDRDDWSSILSALPVAIARGADVVWES